jgi:hypothetical protein
LQIRRAKRSHRVAGQRILKSKVGDKAQQIRVVCGHAGGIVEASDSAGSNWSGRGVGASIVLVDTVSGRILMDTSKALT